MTLTTLPADRVLGTSQKDDTPNHPDVHNTLARFYNRETSHLYDITHEDFGAVADSNGTHGNGTDNYLAIQAAIDAASAAGGGIVFVPPTHGAYFRVTQQLALSSNVWLGGLGMDHSWLFLDTAYGGNFGFLAGSVNSNSNNNSVTGLRMRGPWTGWPSVPSGSYDNGPLFARISKLQIRDCEFDHFPGIGGPIVRGATDLRILDNYCHDSCRGAIEANALYIVSPDTRVTIKRGLIRGNVVQNCGADDLISVSGNFYSIGGVTIILEEVIVVDNILHGLDDYSVTDGGYGLGIRSSYLKNSRIEGNVCKNIGGNGIGITGHTHTRVCGNTIDGAGLEAGAAQKFGIFGVDNVPGETNNVWIKGNVITGAVGGNIDVSNFTGKVFGLYSKDAKSAKELHQTGGTTTAAYSENTGASSRYDAWLLDAASSEAVGCTLEVPDDAIAGVAQVYVVWSNAGGGSGNVKFNCIADSFVSGDNIATATGAISTDTTVAAPLQDVAKRTLVGTVTIAGAVNESVLVELTRVGGDAADTLGNDCEILKIELVCPNQ